jgi:hypothetical protein
MPNAILEKYIAHDNLYYSSADFYDYIIFVINKNGNISQYFK